MWLGSESTATRQFSAPSGTKLEAGDEAFCASGQLGDEKWKTPADGMKEHSGAELNAARQEVAKWEAWRAQKLAERDKIPWWNGVPRIAIETEVNVAEPDHLRKIAYVKLLKASSTPGPSTGARADEFSPMHAVASKGHFRGPCFFVRRLAWRGRVSYLNATYMLKPCPQN